MIDRETAYAPPSICYDVTERPDRSRTQLEGRGQARRHRKRTGSRRRVPLVWLADETLDGVRERDFVVSDGPHENVQKESFVLQ